LNSVTIGSGVTRIGHGVFYNCNALKTITVDENNQVYDSRDNCNAIIETGTNTLLICCKTTAIPNSVTSIGDGAFKDFSSLTSITIPDGVTTIGSGTFAGCRNLTFISIPNGVTSIGGGAFENCSSLTSITIPDSVTSIGGGAFKNCSSLTSITIPDSVTSIGDDVFSGCSSLTSITIPAGVTSIGDHAFKGCCGLTSIAIPAGVTSIGEYAFSGCNSLTTISIPEGVTSIEDYAFEECSSLTSISIPNSVTAIGRNIFYETGWYNNQSDGLLYLDNWLLGSKGKYPSGELTIAEGTKGIACSSYICGETITIPNSVTSIGFGAFDFINQTRIVSMCATPPTCYSLYSHFGNSAFWGHPKAVKNCRLYVPKGTISEYQTTDPWNQFLFVREGIYESPSESDAIEIDAWENAEISEAGDLNKVPIASPSWVDDVEVSWGIPNNSYACFTPTMTTSNYSVSYHSDEVIAGEQYKLQIVFAPETREEMSQLPCKVRIKNRSGEKDEILVKDMIVSGTEVTTFEADDIVVPENHFEVAIETNVSNALIRKNEYNRILRIAAIRLIGNTTTSIAPTEIALSATDCYCTIDGRKIVGKPVKSGLYIVNGKKVVVK